MILLINICKEKLHDYEFVKPIEDILKKNRIKYFKKYYEELTKKDLEIVDKMIICGTSLKDDGFLKNLGRFNWLKEHKKPVLGICGGMQVIGLQFGGKLGKKTEIGYYLEGFNKDFVGLTGKQEVYHLHNNYVKFSDEFIEHTNSEINQAVKHKQKEIYGVLFHPEVRQKGLIINFLKL